MKFNIQCLVIVMVLSGMRQSKTLLTIDERGSKIARNSVFDCYLSPGGRQMAIKNSVSGDFDLRLSIVLTFSFAGVLSREEIKGYVSMPL